MTKDEYMAAIKDARMRALPVPQIFPHTCAVCLHLGSDGFCVVVQDYPPLDFIEVLNKCDGWEPDVPF